MKFLTAPPYYNEYMQAYQAFSIKPVLCVLLIKPENLQWLRVAAVVFTSEDLTDLFCP